MRCFHFTALVSLVLLAPSGSTQSLERARVPGTLPNLFGPTCQVASIGDANADGLQDFLVWGTASAASYQVDARVHSGADGTLLHSYSLIGGAQEHPINSVGLLGDLDGDGILDYGIAGSRRVGSLWEGFVRVRSGVSGAPLFEIPFRSSLNPHTDGLGFGGGIGDVGDLNGDGIHDIGIGAPAQSTPSSITGGLYLFSGLDGTSLFHLLPPPGADLFGETITLLDDLNGDGTMDTLVGAIDEGGHGALYGISGANGARLFRLAGTLSSEAFGSQVVAMDDLDGDGIRDFAVGTRLPHTGPSALARIQVYSGATGLSIYVRNYDSVGAERIWGMSSTMDVNQDGISDLLLACQSEPGLYPGGGMILLVSGSDGSILSMQEGDLPEQDVISVATLGDLTGNGHPDWVVGHFSDYTMHMPSQVQIMHGGCSVQSTPSCSVPANSTGSAASLQAVACGTASNQGLMQLRMTDLPPGEFGYVLMAPQSASVPLAGSTLCLGGRITRLNSAGSGVFFSDADGYASRLIDWASFGQGALVLPGSTWHFQVMHRDRGLPANFHLTHALTVGF